jgi:hypothetical protein
MTRLFALSTPAPSKTARENVLARRINVDVIWCVTRARSTHFCCVAKKNSKRRRGLWMTQVVSPTPVPYLSHIPPTFLRSGFAKRTGVSGVGS